MSGSVRGAVKQSIAPTRRSRAMSQGRLFASTSKVAHRGLEGTANAATSLNKAPGVACCCLRSPCLHLSGAEALLAEAEVWHRRHRLQALYRIGVRDVGQGSVVDVLEPVAEQVSSVYKPIRFLSKRAQSTLH